MAPLHVQTVGGPIEKKKGEPVSTWPIEELKSIPNLHFPILPNKTINDLSTDQYYAYRICGAVILSDIDSDFLNLLKVGPVIHS